MFESRIQNNVREGSVCLLKRLLSANVFPAAFGVPGGFCCLSVLLYLENLKFSFLSTVICCLHFIRLISLGKFQYSMCKLQEAL